MDDQSQQHSTEKDQDSDRSLYRADGASSFSGFDLTRSQPAPQSPAHEPTSPGSSMDALSWEASEYIHHTKSVSWFAGYGALMLLLLAIAYFLTHAVTFMILVVVMAVTIGLFAARPPRTLHYTLSKQGIQIEGSTYSYADFRAFGIITDGAVYSIILIPIKRFMPAVTMYFPEEDGEKIVDILGARLPMQELHPDFVDRLIRKLRF